MTTTAPLGYRDPMTYNHRSNRHKTGLLTTHVIMMEKYALAFENVLAHQYMFEVMQGIDPQESEWFKKSIDRVNRKAKQRYVHVDLFEEE